MPRRPNVREPELAFMLKRLLRWKNGASDETRAGTSLDPSPKARAQIWAHTMEDNYPDITGSDYPPSPQLRLGSLNCPSFGLNWHKGEGSNELVRAWWAQKTTPSPPGSRPENFGPAPALAGTLSNRNYKTCSPEKAILSQNQNQPSELLRSLLEIANCLSLDWTNSSFAEVEWQEVKLKKEFFKIIIVGGGAVEVICGTYLCST